MGTEVGRGSGTELLGAKPREGSGCSAGPCALGLSRFHRHPGSVEVERGGVACFQCLIRGVPEPSISWEHNVTALSTADRRCVSTSRDCGGVAGWVPGHGVEP